MRNFSFYSLLTSMAVMVVLATGCGSDDEQQNGQGNYAVPPSQNCLNMDDPRCFNYNSNYGYGFNNYPYDPYYGGYGQVGRWDHDPRLCGQYYNRGNQRWNTGWDPYRTQAFCYQAGMNISAGFGNWGFQGMCNVRNQNSCPWGTRCVPQNAAGVGYCQ